MTARIYDRPDLDQREGMLALYVAGRLGNAFPSQAYEGRLQIKNAVGACQVRQIDGDKLPDGYQLYVDQATQEVVLAWPAYVAGAAPISNPGFESGPTGWECGAGWKVSTYGPIVGQWSGEYSNNGGISPLSSTSRYSVYPGQRTSAKCKVRQGASSEGNAGASVLLEYRDEAGEVVLTREGNRVMSASKGAVYDSTVNGEAPAAAKTVNIGSNGIRFRENKPLFVDDFEWDHTVAAAGINHNATFQLTLLVSDSRGRSAMWAGSVIVADFVDTKWALTFGRTLWIAEDSNSFPTAQANVFGAENTEVSQLQVNGLIACANTPSVFQATYYADMPGFNVKGVQELPTNSKFALAGRYIVSGSPDNWQNNRLNTIDGSVLSQGFVGGGDIFGDEVVLAQYNRGNNNTFTFSYSFDQGASWTLVGPTAIDFPVSLAGVGNMAVTAFGGTKNGVFRCQFLGKPRSGVNEIISYPMTAEVVDMAYSHDGWIAVFRDNRILTRVWDRSDGWVEKAPVPTAGLVRTLAANTKYILAGTSLGEIFRTVDFCATWQQVPVGPITGDFRAIRVWGEQVVSRETFPDPPIPGPLDLWNAAKARGASNPARLMVVGDSNVEGVGSGAGTLGLTGASETSFPARLAELFGYQRSSWFGDQNTKEAGVPLSTFNPAITLGSGWAPDAAVSSIFGASFMVAAPGAGPLTYSPVGSVTKFRLWYATFTGLNNALQVRIDGVLVDTINTSGSALLTFRDYNVAAGSHNIAVTPTGSGSAFVQGIEAFNGTATPVLLQGGWGGARAANLASAANPWNSLPGMKTIAPDFVIYYCTINDAGAGTSAAAYKGQVETVIEQLYPKANGCLCVGFPANVSGVTNGLYDAYATALKQLAVDRAWFFLDLRDVFGNTWSEANTRGLAYDSHHPNGDGHQAIAAALKGFLPL
ncbi:SGNH/GDSL hydrolase family protein [Stenotrophomonas sp. RAC2]|uniref:SGNH/GDSL hydrolase family protein n=1 Tax=Stenotrophomonas sp. RAC2 TaxID=3064902 RepID=UPI0027191A5D|nr:SGNH/GDSL hydrolase family protein [Stenotrophomonas sp. RAC2]MDV9040898.1 SGNH/GDSL hydrolase family protein [Stenotrophomonas sp. RAC2]